MRASLAVLARIDAAPIDKLLVSPLVFDKPSDARLVTAIDRLNAKFGKGAISYGAAGADQSSKIAFQRVPKLNEF